MTSDSLSRASDALASHDPLLAVRKLTVGFPARAGIALAANGIELSVRPGETLGIVGESGCGKSITIRSILGMVPPPGELLEGEIMWRGRDLGELPERELQAIRGRNIAMIFQDPGTSLNPVHSVGSQIAEILRVKLGLARRESRNRSVELLRSVGIPSAEIRARDYPHQLSGGMRQRVMIAMAIACGPELLLADEPTTGLDVTVQDQILALLGELVEGNRMAMILVSHDLGVIAQTCDTVAVMYAGFIVERGPCDAVLAAPRHPYTRALLAAELVFETASRRETLSAIEGQPPVLSQLPPGCPFQPRCGQRRAECSEVTMSLDAPGSGHASACPYGSQQ